MALLRWTLLLVAWSCFPTVGFAQENARPQPSIEELRADLADTTDPTQKAKLQLRLAYSAKLTVGKRHDAALAAVESLGPGGDPGLRSLALSAVCWTHGRLGRPEPAGEACDRAVEIAREAEDRSRLHTAISARAALAFERGDIDSAKTDFIEAAQLAEALENHHHLASALNNLGSVVRMNGAFYEAVNYYERALEAALLANSDYLEASAANNLAVVSLRLDLPEESLERSRQTLEAAERGGLTSLQFVGKRGIAAARLALGNGESAAAELRALIRDESDLAEPMQLASAYISLAEAELEVGNSEAALAAGLEAVSRYEHAGAQRRRLRAISVLATAMAATGNPTEALTALDEVIDDDADLYLKLTTMQRKTEVLSSIGKYDEAYEVLRDSERLRDRLNGRRAQEQLALIRAGFEANKRDEEIAQLRASQASIEARSKLERSIGIGVVAVTSILLLGGFLLRRSSLRRRRAERESAQARDRQEQDAILQAELERQVELRSTELERQIRERRQLEGQLEQNRKLEALGKLTGGIAHDFNNLMTVVLGSMDMLRAEEGKPIGIKHLDLVESAATAARSGAGITESLLAFARVQNLHPSEVRVVDFFEDIKGLIRQAVGEGISLDLQCDSPEIGVFVDADQLTTALINLAANARDSMGGRGQVTIRATDSSDSPSSFPDSGAGRYTEISVTDTGTGMTPEQLERACEPFFSTKDDGAGSGLGLSMVFGFAKQSGGDLRMVSSPGAGTTATILLPRYSYQRSAPKDPPAAARRCFDGMSALVVEDRPEVRALMQNMLTHLGFAVEVSEDADAARRWFQSGRHADLVLSDIVMPGEWNGVELADWLKAEHPEIKVLLTSGFPESYSASASGARFLRKPFRLEQLTDSIEALLNRDSVTRHRS